VRDEVGTIVYTETKKCEPNEYNNITTLTNTDNQNQITEGVQKTFTVVVPEPGKYTYSFVTTAIYTIINGDTISDSYNSETYSFSISAAVFYDESDDDTINITPSSTY